MKAIIYAGIGLFSIASVYGVADYYNSKKNGELKKLYVEEKVPVVAPAPEEKTTVVIGVKNAEPKVAETKVVKAKARSLKKAKKTEKKFRFENFSRARIPEREIIEDTVIEKKNKQQN
jgi:hypothetical protein